MKIKVAPYFIKGPYTNIWGHPEIGAGTEIGSHVEIGDGVKIGNDCSIQAGAFIPSGVEIGNNVFIGPRACFTNDKYPQIKGTFKAEKTIVGDGVVIGANATILPGITIEKNAFIGAGSVITRNIPAGQLWLGNPAKPRERGEEKMLEEIMWVETNCWPPELQASRAKMQTRLEVFPEGVVFAEVQGKIVGVSTSLIFDYNTTPTSWEIATHNGWIVGAHNPRGNALYIVSVGVAKQFQGQGHGATLLKKQKEVAESLELKHLVLGSRVPSAHLQPDKPIEDVVDQDKEVKFYKKNGFEVVQIVANYMEDDPESLNYGVVMCYTLPPRTTYTGEIYMSTTTTSTGMYGATAPNNKKQHVSRKKDKKHGKKK